MKTFSWEPSFQDLGPGGPRLVLSIAVGSDAQAQHEVTGPSQKAYADRIGAQYLCLQDKTQDWGFGEKFRAHDFAQIYDRVLFLDADVLVLPTCPDLFDLVPAGSVGWHDDRPYLSPGHWKKVRRDGLDLWASLGRPCPAGFLDKVYNTGVVVFDKTCPVFRPPAKTLAVTHLAEQWHCQATAHELETPVYDLPREFNWQWWSDTQEKHRTSCHAWHAAGMAHARGEAGRLETLESWAQEAGL